MSDHFLTPALSEIGGPTSRPVCTENGDTNILMTQLADQGMRDDPPNLLNRTTGRLTMFARWDGGHSPSSYGIRDTDEVG